VEQLARRDMELLRGQFFPLLDNLFAADGAALEDLEEFAARLLGRPEELDAGLFCQIRQALLSMARQNRDRAGAIRELYWLGMGRHSRVSKLVGLELPLVEKFVVQMRLCFTEAAAYLKYYDELEDAETRGYILRSRANIALGPFKSPGEKIRLVKQTLQILQDKGYQEKAPELPWDRYIYMTHQHMASSISYRKDTAMSAEDMADIMESVYIVNQRQVREAEARGERTPMRWIFPYHAIEYYCGMHSLEQLLAEIEKLLDAVDPTDFSADGMYGMGSLLAFYCQYLQQYPEYLPERVGYLEGLYRRVMAYVDAFPREQEAQKLFWHLRQLAYTFVETGSGLSYGDFVEKIMLRFAPEAYIHAQTVGEAARVLCDLYRMQVKPQDIIGAFGMQMRKLYSARLALDRRRDASYVGRLWGMKFPATRLMNSARHFSLPWCRRAVVRCAQTDLAMKSTGQDANELLTALLLELANTV